jgi:hypothetical protein
MEMKEQFIADTYAFVEAVFPTTSIKREDYHTPESTEINISISQQPVNNITLAFYDSILMQLDEYRYEFDEYNAASYLEIRKYLQAAADGNLQIIHKRILGITICNKLEIL